MKIFMKILLKPFIKINLSYFNGRKTNKVQVQVLVKLLGFNQHLDPLTKIINCIIT